MATPLTADKLLKALRDEGLRVVEHRNWRMHNRNHVGSFGPVHGVMIHHTVTSGDTEQQTLNSVELCYNGHASLPGPLCQGVIAKDGTVYLVGNGRCNHAGLGDGDVLQAVIDEVAPPADNQTDTDGNRHFYGFECINRGDGNDPWPEAQLLAMEKASAALCRAHGWSYRSVIRHLDWQPGKVDPRGVDWSAMQSRIRTRLAGGTAPTPPPEADMPLTTEDVKKILTTDNILKAPADAADAATNTHWTLATHVQETTSKVRSLHGAVALLAAKVEALETTGLTTEQMNTLAELVADKLAARLAD